NTQESFPILLHRVEGDDGNASLILNGKFTLMALAQRLKALSSELASHAADPELRWDLTGIEQMDDAGAVLLWRAWGSRYPSCLKMRPEQERLFKRVEEAPVPPEAVRHDFLLPLIVSGNSVFLLWQHLVGMVILIGEVALDAKYLLFHP